MKLLKRVSLVLALAAIPLFAVACQDLETDTLESTTTEESLLSDTTSTDEAGDAAPGDDGDDGDGDDGSPEVSLLGTAYIVTTTAGSMGLGDHWTFDDDDNHARRTVGVDDQITVVVHYSPAVDGVTDDVWRLDGDSIVVNHGVEETKDSLDRFLTQTSYLFVTTAPGETRLRIVPYRLDGSLADEWWVDLVVE